MKVLDRYILRELFIPILFCSLSLITLILVADVFDNLSDFLRYKTPLSIIGKYYLSLVPFAFVQTISWATWLGTLFLLVNFGFHNELLAMKVAGIKIASIIRPILFLGFLVGIMTFMVSDRLMPKSYLMAQELSAVYIEKKTTQEEGEIVKNVTFYSALNQIYYCRSLSLGKNSVEDMIVLWIDSVSQKTRQRVTAQSGTWNGKYWELNNVTEHQIDSRGRILGEPRSYSSKAYPDLDAHPNDLANASRDSILLSYREMKKVTHKLAETGVNVHSEMVDLQYRLASPWQSLVMMLITIPLLGSTRTRKGIAQGVLICVLIIFSYHLTSAIGVAVGKSGFLLPFLGAWAGNIIFSVGALLFLDKANF